MGSIRAQLTSVEGTASDVRQARATIVSSSGYGADWDNSWGDSYECLFRLSGKPVALRANGPIFIEDGESVKVVGVYNRNGVFEAAAYYNRSSGVSGRSEWALSQFQAVAVAAVGGILVFLMMFTRAQDTRYGRDHGQFGDLLFSMLVLTGLVIMLYGLIVFMQYRRKIRAIERLLNDAQP